MTAQAARALREVFWAPKYLALTLVTAALVFVLALWLPNIVLVRDIVLSGAAPLGAKLRILLGLVGSITTNYTPVVAAELVTASLLFGVNVSLFIRGVGARWRVGAGGSGFLASLGGMTSSLVGIGCASCGIFILGPFLALLGGASLLTALPFGGAEFIILGIGLLAVSLWLQVRALEASAVCSPKGSSQILGIREEG